MPQPGIETLFSNQREYFNTNLRGAPVSARIKKLKKLRRWILDHRTEIIAALQADFGKPAVEVELSETKVVLKEIDFALNHIRSWSQTRRVPTPLVLFGARSSIRVEPRGVVLIIAPWNFPFNLTIGPLVSALAAGNAVMLKPSEFTPHATELMSGMIAELFPPREVALVTGDGELAARLTRLPFDHIFFTGSPRVGKMVMRAAAENLTSVTLELGGQNPVIVDESALIPQTARRILYGKMLNAGQSCVAANYLFVHRSVAGALKEELKRQLSAVLSASDNTDRPMARLVDSRHMERVEELLDDSLNSGAEALNDFERDRQQALLSPVLLWDVPAEAQIMKQEIFGPVLPVMVYDELDALIEYLRRKPRPLALYIFSRRRKNINRIINGLSSGAVGINETTAHFFNPHLPFGGAGYSGIGQTHGYYGFMTFSHSRALFKQPARFAGIDLVRPPYTRFVKKITDFIVRYL